MARNGDTRVAPARAMSLREEGWRKAPGARLQDCAGRGDAAGPDRRRAGGRAARRRCRRLRHTAPRARRTAAGNRPYGRPATARRRPRERRNDYGEQLTAADRQQTMPVAATTAIPPEAAAVNGLGHARAPWKRRSHPSQRTPAGLCPAVSATDATPAATTTDTTTDEKEATTDPDNEQTAPANRPRERTENPVTRIPKALRNPPVRAKARLIHP